MNRVHWPDFDPHWLKVFDTILETRSASQAAAASINAGVRLQAPISL